MSRDPAATLPGVANGSISGVGPGAAALVGDQSAETACSSGHKGNRDSCTNRVVDFCDRIRLQNEVSDVLGLCRRPDMRLVSNVGRRQTNAGEIGSCLDNDPVDRHIQASSLAIEVIAVAGRERKHEELAAVDRRPLP